MHVEIYTCRWKNIHCEVYFFTNKCKHTKESLVSLFICEVNWVQLVLFSYSLVSNSSFVITWHKDFRNWFVDNFISCQHLEEECNFKGLRLYLFSGRQFKDSFLTRSVEKVEHYNCKSVHTGRSSNVARGPIVST